jgi:hypothetical protein
MSNSEDNAAATSQTLRLFYTVDDVFHKVYTHLLPMAHISHSPAILIHISRLLKVPTSPSADSCASCAHALSLTIESHTSHWHTSGTSTRTAAKRSTLARCEAFSRIWLLLALGGRLKYQMQCKDSWIIWKTAMCRLRSALPIGRCLIAHSRI